jgi:hypothetical protein
MDAMLKPPGLLGWTILVLLGAEVIGWTYGALGKTLMGRSVSAGASYLLTVWSLIFGLALIAVVSWLLASSMLGESVWAVGLTLFLVVTIGANVLNDVFGGSE